MSDKPNEQAVRHNRDQGRFEVQVGGDVAYLEYGVAADGTVVITHTEVPEAAEGQGIGGALARAALEQARADGQRVRVSCPFVAAYLLRHPEYSDVVRNS